MTPRLTSKRQSGTNRYAIVLSDDKGCAQEFLLEVQEGAGIQNVTWDSRFAEFMRPSAPLVAFLEKQSQSRVASLRDASIEALSFIRTGARSSP